MEPHNVTRPWKFCKSCLWPPECEAFGKWHPRTGAWCGLQSQSVACGPQNRRHPLARARQAKNLHLKKTVWFVCCIGRWSGRIWGIRLLLVPAAKPCAFAESSLGERLFQRRPLSRMRFRRTWHHEVPFGSMFGSQRGCILLPCRMLRSRTPWSVVTAGKKHRKKFHPREESHQRSLKAPFGELRSGEMIEEEERERERERRAHTHIASSARS